MAALRIDFALLAVLLLAALAACGDDTSTPRLAQNRVAERPEATTPAGEFVPVSVREGDNCEVRGDGFVECQRRSEFVSISIGRFHNCGVRNDGSVECWRRDGTDKGPE